MDAEQARLTYRDFFQDLSRFERALKRVRKEWPKSCEHFLTNPSLNRVAWLGQASVCLTSEVSRNFRSGFRLLSVKKQQEADDLAQSFLEKWLEAKWNEQRIGFENTSKNGKNKGILKTSPTKFLPS